MAGDFESIVRAIEEQDPAIGDMPIPDTYLAATLHKSDEQMFAGRASRDKDPRESLHIEQVPTPELAAGEALIAVMASSINYNTVWSSIFEPVSTFGFLDRYARTNPDATRHNRNYHVLGSDASGVVLQTGPGVHTWNPGDRVVAHCLSVELESPLGHNDTMMDPEQRIWGFETNFGGLAQLAITHSEPSEVCDGGGPCRDRRREGSGRTEGSSADEPEPISEPVFDYLVTAVHLTAEFGHRLLPYYRFDAASGLWQHQDGPIEPPLRLKHLSYDANGRLTYTVHNERAPESALEGYLSSACALLRTLAEPDLITHVPGASDDFETLRWFDIARV